MLAKKKSGQGQAILFDELITLIYPTLQIYEKFLEKPTFVNRTKIVRFLLYVLFPLVLSCA